MQIFHNIKFDLIITTTYVLMDNFCSCFIFRAELADFEVSKYIPPEDVLQVYKV